MSITETPPGKASTDDCARCRIPLTKTKRLCFASSYTRMTVNSLPPGCRLAEAGANFSFAIAATFVYLHSSSLTDGKPVRSKCAKESSRIRRSHDGSALPVFSSNDRKAVSYELDCVANCDDIVILRL